MRKWFDADTHRTYIRIDDLSELSDFAFITWRGIAKLHQCSRATAMRCLRDLEGHPSTRLSESVVYFLIRAPGARAETRRAAPPDLVAAWFAGRRSVGNPNFTDSGYQSALASRPRGLR